MTAHLTPGGGDRALDGGAPPAGADRPVPDDAEHIDRKIEVWEPQADRLDRNAVAHERDEEYDALIRYLWAAITQADRVIALAAWPPSSRSTYIPRLLHMRDQLAVLPMAWRQMADAAATDDIAEEPPSL